MDYTALQVKTSYSILESLNSISKLVSRASSLGYTSLSITDTNNLLGNYNISVTGANYSVDGNNLTITPTVNGNITVKLTKQMPLQ